MVCLSFVSRYIVRKNRNGSSAVEALFAGIITVLPFSAAWRQYLPALLTNGLCQ
jgi:hypothetical protein